MDSIARDIDAGKYRPGQKLPAEAALGEQFQTSRITIGRALRELKQRGILRGVAGSGTFVQNARHSEKGMLFGLLIPGLGETEIFEPICQGIARAPQAKSHALLWGHTDAAIESKGHQALQLCNQFIERKVSGVFFAPLEFTSDKDSTNLKIIEMLERAHIPVVLLDRCVLPFPRRTSHDLVGIDNRRAGYLATAHLIATGCRKIGFVAMAGAASTTGLRIAGYREALYDSGFACEPKLVRRVECLNQEEIRAVMDSTNARGFVCGNDRTAGQFMHGLLGLNYRVPEDVRIVGIDDVEYAKLLPVPLTTIHQPGKEIGEAAMSMMLERIARPGMVSRDVYLECQLVVRRSSVA